MGLANPLDQTLFPERTGSQHRIRQGLQTKRATQADYAQDP